MPALRLRFHRPLIAAIVTATIGLAGAAVSGAQAATDDFSVTVSPATSTGAADKARTRFSFALRPGQTVTDAAYVENAGTAPLSFTAYVADAFNDDKGTFSLYDGQTKPVDLGSWVTIAPENRAFSLKAGEHRVIPFTITVPANATPGDHAGGFVVSSVAKDAAQVTIDRRVGVRMYARVDGELQSLLSLGGLSTRYEYNWLNPFDGTLYVTFTLSNTGNVATAANATVQVNSLLGIPVGSSPKVDVPEVLPGQRRTQEIKITGVGQWFYQQPVLRISGKAGAQGEDSRVTYPKLDRDAVLWVAPVDLLVLIALAALVWLLLRWRSRRAVATRADSAE